LHPAVLRRVRVDSTRFPFTVANVEGGSALFGCSQILRRGAATTTEYALVGGRKCVIFQLIDDHSATPT